jgi:hypothetical protein
VNDAQAKKWEKTRRWGIGFFCIPKVFGVFVVISFLDYFLVGRDWVRLVGELRENLLVAAVAGTVFGFIDWRRKERLYKEFLRTQFEEGGG